MFSNAPVESKPQLGCRWGLIFDGVEKLKKYGCKHLTADCWFNYDVVVN